VLDVPRFLLRFGFLASAAALPFAPATAQPAARSQSQSSVPGLCRLAGNDAKRAAELAGAIRAAVDADRWDEAAAKADELFALRKRAQGPRHFQTINAEWNLKTVRRLAPMSQEDKAAYQSSLAMTEQGATLQGQGKHVEAQRLFEGALETCRRLLSDDNPATGAGYAWLAESLQAQAKYPQAQPLYQKALEIQKRLLRHQPAVGPESDELRSLLAQLRAQRFASLAPALGATAGGLPAASRLIVLTSRAMTGVAVEAILSSDDTRTVSYAPSATVFRYLRAQPRPGRRAGLLALGDPVFELGDKTEFVGFTQALLMSGARSVCLSLWKVDDTATALLMTRFYQNMLGKRAGLTKPMPKTEALREAKTWLRNLPKAEADAAEAELPRVLRGAPRTRRQVPVAERPYGHPHFWAAFVLSGDPD
jgi:tetratricopeptide (TPR) repeat protein